MKFVDFDIKNKFFLAPLAGVYDLAARSIARECGASLCYSEMVSAKALLYNDKKTMEILRTNKDDTPLVVQLFGHEPDIIADGIKKIASHGYRMADINCGCPMPKIVNNGDGAALMKDEKLFEKVIRAAVNASYIPVSVKIRAGYTEDTKNAVELAKIAEACGSSAITVHGRTKEQLFSGKSDWNIIKKVKEAVNIPVIGNGDVNSPEDAERMLNETGCDFVMIGRGALGKPFLFTQLNDYFETGNYKKNYSLSYKATLLRRQLEIAKEYKGDRRATLEARKHLAWYLKGIKNSKAYREAANTVSSANEINELLNRLIQAENNRSI